MPVPAGGGPGSHSAGPGGEGVPRETPPFQFLARAPTSLISAGKLALLKL